MRSSDKSKEDPAEPAFWAAFWQAGETRWDLGRAYPGLDELLGAARSSALIADGDAVLEPGAGRAHTGAALAGLGFKVTAFDVVEEAIQAARLLYENIPGLTLLTADALAIRPEWTGKFQAIFDRAVLCALPESKRSAYARAAFAHLAPGGAFLSAVVTERRENPEAGPPFAVPESSLDAMLAPGFSCVYRRTLELPVVAGGNVAKELRSVWRRLDRWQENG